MSNGFLICDGPIKSRFPEASKPAWKPTSSTTQTLSGMHPKKCKSKSEKGKIDVFASRMLGIKVNFFQKIYTALLPFAF